MAGNTFGKLFTITTFGESHGKAIGVVIDGVKPGMPLTEADIQVELDRRRPGQSMATTQRKEPDKAEILSGVFEEKTTGTPIAIVITNTDANPKDYENLKDVFRPGHADFAYLEKFGVRDWRGGGRASGRETAARVAAGAVAKKMLKEQGVTVTAYTKEIAGIVAENLDLNSIENNPVRCPDAKAAKAMLSKIDEARKTLDSVGGIIEAIVTGCPPGLGDPVFDKLDAKLSQAIMSIGAVKGIEFGDGFKASSMKGSEFNDAYKSEGGKTQVQSNHGGGISGGISNGGDIVLRTVVRPTCSIAQPQDTITKGGEATSIQIKGRHDPCICPRAVVVVEAMIAVTLADCLLIQKSIQSK
ncbi:MAG: chorismate synthase [Candidatus Aceula meridiana]|nr:chorismate synthase [Candidatus Aceula meridiana]